MTERSENIVLVLASPEDIHADAVISYLSTLGREVIRIHVGEVWPESSTLAWRADHRGITAELCWKGRVIRPENVGAVFCRDFSFAKCRDEDSIEAHLGFAEARAALFGFFRCLEHVHWINPPWYDEMADNKLYQYACAQALGLKIPKTLITNRPDMFTMFYEECNRQVIIKQLSEVCLIEAVNNTDADDIRAYGFFTNTVENQHLAYLDEIVTTPCLLQERVEKKADIRVTVVGRKVFAALIDSQSNDKTRTDFRHDPTLPVHPFVLPSEVRKKLLTLLKKWRINFAACDFALSDRDELIFLEANVVGNWLWIESAVGIVISKEIADQLDAACCGKLS